MASRGTLLLLFVPCLLAGASEAATVTEGDDWSVPAWAAPVAGTFYFSEDLDALSDITVRSVDVTWRQLNPAPGTYSTTATGAAQGMSFPSYDDQLASPDPFWMRIWASGVDWAPTWVVSDCGITQTWTDYDGQDHLPIWDPCVWGHLMDLYRELFVTRGLRLDPRLELLYVPGAFTWCEFDFDIIDQAAADGLTHATFDTWFQAAMAEMVTIFDGDNGDPSDDRSYKLVYTGEDYPFGPWDELDDLFARDAVVAGLGIRTGITELFNFHLNHIPAYGATIAQDGHILVDETWPLLAGPRTIATENECYNACGYATADPYYAVKMSNLKALQMRVNRLYVVPEDSYLADYPEHWNWVRHSLGRRPDDAFDAWVALREAEDRYWVDDTSHDWTGKPWVHNLERWLVQKDQAPDGMSERGSDVRVEVLDPDNGTSYEGRRTNPGAGQGFLYFFVDELFASGDVGSVELKVTYLDEGTASFHVDYAAAAGPAATESVPRTNSGLVHTATFVIDDAIFSGSLTGGADFRIDGGGEPFEARFVRLVKTDDSLVFGDGFESGDTSAWP